MNAVHTTALPIPGPRVAGIGVLRTLLLGEAALALVLTIFLSLLAGGMRDFLGGDSGLAAEQSIRFAAGGAFLFVLGAALASRAARRRLSWGWTLAALLQLVLAIGSGIAVMIAGWHPVYLLGFALAAAVMLILSTASVRRALGQE